MPFSNRPDFEGYMPESMSRKDYLLRSTRPAMQNIRRLISQWFSHYPDQEKDNWKSSFLSSEQIQHDAAFFELFMHELLRSTGWSMKIHPTIDSTQKRPDFLCTKNDTSFYLEAKITTGKSEQEEKAISRLNTAMQQINQKVKSRFFSLGIDTEGLPERMINSRKLTETLNSWLSSLNHEECLRLQKQYPSIDYREAGLRMQFEAYPKHTPIDTESILAVFSHGHEGGIITPHIPIRDALKNKANKYGNNLKKPYIIAINSLNVFANVRQDALSALYGAPCIRYQPGAPHKQPTPARDNNGSFCLHGKKRKPQVSGAFIFENITPITRYQNSKALFVPNISATFPMQTPLPQICYMADNGRELTLKESSTIGHLLKLPENWPENIDSI